MVFHNRNMHNMLTNLVIPRVQQLVGWKGEPSQVQSIYTRLEHFSTGSRRSVSEFVEMMQIDTQAHKQTPPDWCIEGTGMPPPLSNRQIVHRGVPN